MSQGFNRRVERHRSLMAVPVLGALWVGAAWCFVIFVWLDTLGWWPFS